MNWKRKITGSKPQPSQVQEFQRCQLAARARHDLNDELDSELDIFNQTLINTVRDLKNGNK